jgi:uncharacterized protein YcfJ
MKHFLIYGGVAALLLTSCETKTQSGALIGGGSGAIIGGAVGGGQGALIGGAVGVIGGALIGSALDDADRQRVEQQNPRTLNRIDNGEELSIHDIIALHASGVKDDKIIELIQKTNSHYTLNTYKIQRLREAGVSDRVINYMMST